MSCWFKKGYKEGVVVIDWKEMLEFLKRFENGITIDKLISICKREKQWDSKDVSSCLRFLGKSRMISAENFKIKAI